MFRHQAIFQLDAQVQFMVQADAQVNLTEKDILNRISSAIENYQQGKGYSCPKIFEGVGLKIQSITDGEMQLLFNFGSGAIEQAEKECAGKIANFLREKLKKTGAILFQHEVDKRTPIPYALEYFLVIKPEDIGKFIVKVNDYLQKPSPYVQGAAMGAFEDTHTPFAQPEIARCFGSFFSRKNANLLVLNKRAKAYAIAEENREIENIQSSMIKK